MHTCPGCGHLYNLNTGGGALMYVHHMCEWGPAERDAFERGVRAHESSLSYDLSTVPKVLAARALALSIREAGARPAPA